MYTYRLNGSIVTIYDAKSGAPIFNVVPGRPKPSFSISGEIFAINYEGINITDVYNIRTRTKIR